ILQHVHAAGQRVADDARAHVQRDDQFGRAVGQPQVVLPTAIFDDVHDHASDCGAAASCGKSLLPMMVRFKPTCTITSLPSTSTAILSLMFQPSDPVENSLTMAIISLPPMTTGTGLAAVRNCSRVMASDALEDLAIRVSFREWSGLKRKTRSRGRLRVGVGSWIMPFSASGPRSSYCPARPVRDRGS